MIIVVVRNDIYDQVFYYFSNSSPAHFLRQLSPMFEVDPLFKRTFLLTLPICDIAKMQKNIFALHEVCWTLTRVVVERDTPLLSDEEVRY